MSAHGKTLTFLVAVQATLSCAAACVERRVGCAEIFCAGDEPICVSPCDRYEYRGSCYAKTNRCCSDDNCPVGTCDTGTGYCREYTRCTCFDDMDCPGGLVCHSNHTVCGICTEPPQDCLADAECAGDEYCADGGYCQQICCP